MKKAQDLKVNDLMKSTTNTILKVVKVTPTRVIYINTENPSLGKVVMGFNQLNYWLTKGMEIL